MKSQSLQHGDTRNSNRRATAGAVIHPGTPFLRKWLSAMERLAMALAEEGIRDGGAVLERFDNDMDWSSDALVAQFDRCSMVIEAMHQLHLRHGQGAKPRMRAVK